MKPSRKLKKSCITNRNKNDLKINGLKVKQLCFELEFFEIMEIQSIKKILISLKLWNYFTIHFTEVFNSIEQKHHFECSETIFKVVAVILTSKISKQ